MTARRRTRRGFGAIRKLPSKRFQASYVGPDLHRYPASTTFGTRGVAEGWLDRQRKLIESGDWKPPVSKLDTVPTVAAYADTWLAVRDLKPRTRTHYRWLLTAYIVPGLGDLTVTTVTTAAVRAWYGSLTTGPTARAHAYSLLRSILATAVEDELLPVNPARIRGASKSKRVKEIRPATLDELVVLTEAMPPRLRLLIQLSAWCALRFGEVTELRRKDVDVKRGVVRIDRGVVRDGGEVIVDDPKSEAGKRPVHFPPHLAPMIKAHLRKHAQLGPDGLLFYGKAGGQLPHSSLLYHFNAAKHLARRDDLTPHALRHTGATLAAQSGATIKELMSRVGHSTPTMAIRYQHASEERDLLLAQKLSKLAEGEPRG